MFFRQIHRFFSFRRLLILLLGLSALIQVIVITYNHYSGYEVIGGFESFLSHFLIGSFFSLLAAFMIAYPDLYMIWYLNKRVPWGGNIIRRVVIQLIFSAVVAIIMAIGITLFVNMIKPYDKSLSNVLLNNALITAVNNVILMSILEGWTFYIESRKARQLADNLKDELSQIKYEVLKSQINPHFMFNSLNVLSGLIEHDVSKAQLFIDEFSQIYRYVLESIEQPVVRLGKEIDFMRSYLFLQQIRYGENLTYTIDIEADLLNLFLPPLSLQVVLENATKHNIVNDSKPLKIEVYNEGNSLVIRNNLQSKISSGKSTGLGLKNMVKRYNLITELEPTFKIENNYYIARLPLINSEPDEHTDHRG